MSWYHRLPCNKEQQTSLDRVFVDQDHGRVLSTLILYQLHGPRARREYIKKKNNIKSAKSTIEILVERFTEILSVGEFDRQDVLLTKKKRVLEPCRVQRYTRGKALGDRTTSVPNSRLDLTNGLVI